MLRGFIRVHQAKQPLRIIPQGDGIGPCHGKQSHKGAFSAEPWGDTAAPPDGPVAWSLVAYFI